MDQRLGITAQQRLVIRCVGKYPGMTAGRLAQLLHIDPGTASATLKRLDEKGILTRRRDPRDRRRTALGLTAKGRQLDRPLQGSVEDAAQRLLSEVRPADTRRAVSLLERLAKLLEMSPVRRPRLPKRAPAA
jgi:DNA-binding MarR family transcriptional regulator